MRVRPIILHEVDMQMEVSLDGLVDAGKLRYCWSDGGQCSLKAMNGLPVSSFELNLLRE